MASHLPKAAIAIAIILGLSNLGSPAGTFGEAPSEQGILEANTTWTVYSTADAGEGSLRHAVQSAGYGDLISFDAAVFPIGSPSSIYLSSALPALTVGNVTLDATGAGVVLDGSGLPGDAIGLQVASDSNVVRGLQILYFPGAGMLLPDSAAANTVEGNVISSNGGSCGLEIRGARNVIVGNFIGTDAVGSTGMGNSNHGVCISDSSGNRIGPGNVIAHNGGVGIKVNGATAAGNTITQNAITANTLEGIRLEDGGNGGLAAPLITVCTDTTISGTAPVDCVIEVFSDEGAEGKTYEGTVVSDGTGAFSFTKPGGLAGPHITATATDSAGNTSRFSPAASVANQPATWSEIKAEFTQ
jgi:hypothetical protein